MSDRTPAFRTGPLWVVLFLLLFGGTVASAFFVWALTDLFSSGRWYVDAPLLIAGGFVATFLFLLLSGLLYRVDRLRGVPHREVRLFE